MLQILRNKAQSTIIQAIVVIIALVFIFWGVGPNLMNRRSAAIVVNDMELSFQEYQNAYERTYDAIRAQFGGTIPESLADMINVKDQVINQLVQEALLKEGAAEMGIRVSTAEVADAINDMVQFHENGRFSMEKYERLLAANRLVKTKYEEQVRIDLLADKVRSSISTFAATATDKEIENLYRLEKSTVAINYVPVKAAEFEETVTVDEAELEEWFGGVKDNYKTAPQVKLNYLDFNYSDVGEKITIEENRLREYYQSNIPQFTTQEKRKISHILFKADDKSSADSHRRQRERAEEIRALARQGADFAELARQHSEGPSSAQGGSLGVITKGRMVKPFEDAAFALPEGDISDVVKTRFGYHIIKVYDITPSSTQPFAKVKDEILTTLRTKEAKPLAFELAGNAYENIISSGSLDNYLASHPEAELKKTAFFSQQNPPAEIGYNQKFLQAAFSLKEKELSSLIETDSGYAILFAEAVKPPMVPELSAVKEEATADYKKMKAKEKAEEIAEKILSQARESASLATAASEKGYTVQESDYINKNDADGTALPGSLVEEAFKLSVKTPYPEEPLAMNSTYYAFEFVDRKIPQQPLTAEERKRYENIIVQRKQQQVLSGWLANKRQSASISIHKRL